MVYNNTNGCYLNICIPYSNTVIDSSSSLFMYWNSWDGKRRKANEVGLRNIGLGAYIEYCYLPCLWGEDSKMSGYKRQSIEEFFSFVRVDSERGFIFKDLG